MTKDLSQQKALLIFSLFVDVNCRAWVLFETIVQQVKVPTIEKKKNSKFLQTKSKLISNGYISILFKNFNIQLPIGGIKQLPKKQKKGFVQQDLILIIDKNLLELNELKDWTYYQNSLLFQIMEMEIKWINGNYYIQDIKMVLNLNQCMMIYVVNQCIFQI
ncbi:unnamed protein product [Paramecium octaurelia]|uniref:Uncharacterized protein n=1 Tax=Paramecium octaurelia TaxID=43137 RepID=A0A8S1V855_PAROT|nr:unnamed protein product [Paramecium octaurelia]